jgi:hypothetical protein
MLDVACHGLSLSCLLGNCASPSVRCDYLPCTSVVYGHPPTYTVCSFTQYNLTSHQLFNFMVPFKTVPKPVKLNATQLRSYLRHPPAVQSTAKGKNGGRRDPRSPFGAWESGCNTTG